MRTGGEEVCDETVKLIAADKSTRNNYLLTEHAYTVAAAYDALNPTFNSRVTIVKTKRGVTLDLLKYVLELLRFPDGLRSRR